MIRPHKKSNISKTLGSIDSIINFWILGLPCKSVVMNFHEKSKQFDVITNDQLLLTTGTSDTFNPFVIRNS